MWFYLLGLASDTYSWLMAGLWNFLGGPHHRKFHLTWQELAGAHVDVEIRKGISSLRLGPVRL